MATPATTGGAVAAPAVGSLSAVRLEGADNPTGAMVKRIDLSMPPFHGLDPHLALGYHSRQGDGPLGVGWMVDGLSTIQLASPGKGIASFDGTTDVYLLEGELLHPCSPGTASPSCLYPTIAGSFSYYFTDIERYKRIGRDPATGAWAVWLQNGTRLDYTESTLTSTGKAANWLLTTVTDTSGNRVAYAYTAAAPGVGRLPATIQYGKTVITFHYAARSYPVSYGIGGATVIADNRLLTTIDEQTNGSRLRAYGLGYTTSSATGRLLLATVQEFGRDATLDAGGAVDKGASPSFFPPTSLHYKSDPDGNPAESLDAALFAASAGHTAGFARDSGEARLTVLNPSGARHISLDLNGDGLTDHVIMVYDPAAAVGDVAVPTTFQAYLAQPGGSLKAVAPFTTPIVNPAGDLLQIQLADVNGDHRPDIIVMQPIGSHMETATLFFDAEAETFSAVTDNGLTGVPVVFFATGSDDARDVPLPHGVIVSPQFLAGDFNGDGYADIALANAEGPDRVYVMHVALGRGDASFTPIAPWATNRSASTASHWLVGDLNNDGRSDLVYVGADAYDAETPSNPAPGSHVLLCGDLSSTASEAAFRVHPFVPQCQTTAIPAYQGYDACKWTDVFHPIPVPSMFTSARDVFMIADVNGDGSKDLVRIGADLDVATCNARPFPRDSTYQTYQAILSNGDGSFTAEGEQAPRLATKSTSVLVADLDGDGRDDLLTLAPVMEGTACDPGVPAGSDCAPQASVIQIRFQGVRWTDRVTMDIRTATPGLAYPFTAFTLTGIAGIATALDTIEVGDFNGSGHPQVAVWHRTHDSAEFLDDFGWNDKGRTSPCTAACPYYDALFHVRTWQPGTDPVDTGHWMVADVNGDGLPDYVKAEVEGLSLTLFVRLRQPGNSFLDLPPAVFPVPFGFQPATLHVADVNADGLADLVAVRAEDGLTPGSSRARVVTLLASGGGAFGLSQWLLDTPHRMPENGHWFAADTNGDGKANLIYISNRQSSDQACLRHVRLDVLRWSQGFTEPQPGSSLPPVPVSVWSLQPSADVPACAAGANSPDWYVYDADRNGTQDFSGAWAVPGGPTVSYAAVSILAGRDGKFRAVNSTTTSRFDSAPWRWRPIDLNGDGLPELASVVTDITDTGQAKLASEVLLSSGDRTMKFQHVFDAGPMATALARDFIFFDWNGDGRTDLAHLRFDHGDLLVQPFVSNGAAFNPTAESRFPRGVSYPDLGQIRPLSTDGSPRQRLEYLDAGYLPGKILALGNAWYAAPRLVGDLLSEIDTPLGAQTSVDYALMTSAQLPNQPGVCQLPPSPGYLVSKLSVAPGGGSAVAESIDYACPRYSPAERTLWAWRQISRSESGVAGRPSRTTAETWDTDDQCGARLQMSVVSGGGSRQQLTMVNPPPDPAAPYHCQAVQTTTQDDDPGGSLERVELFGYDPFGRVAQHQELGDSKIVGDERTTQMTSEIAADPYIVTTATATLYAGRGTAGTLLQQSEYCYDGAAGCVHHATDRGLLTAERRFSDTDGGFITLRAFDHDAQGNVTTVTDANGFATTLDYDKTLGLYPVVLRDAAGHESQLEWDLVLGEPTAVTDPNGIRSDVRTYDALGRVTSVATADHGKATIDYRFWGLPTQSVFTSVADGSPSGLWTDDHFDGLGRSILVRKKDSETGPAYVFQTSYGDLSNNPKQVTHGALEGAAAVPVETFAWDFLGRPASVTHPDGSTKRVSIFAAGASEVDEVGHRKDFAYDAYGNVLTLSEAGVQTMVLEHDLLGRLGKIHDAANNTITYGWNSLSRVMTETDPDLGARSFTYDHAGNLTGTTDANGNVVTVAYDNLGRPVSKIVNGSAAVTWTYDEPGHGSSVGRLTSVTDAASGCPVARSVSYGVLGQPIAETRCWDGTSYSVGRIFDPLGRLVEFTYPSAANKAPADGESLAVTYEPNGLPSGLSGIVAASTHDPEGRLLTRRFASGAEADYTYDSQREWPATAAFHFPSLANVLLTYGFNPDGWLAQASSTSPTRHLDTAYSVDALHRLAGAQRTLGGTTTSQTFAYDAIGNMSQAGADIYTYPTAGNPLVHAVQGIGPRSFQYDKGGNLTKLVNSAVDEQRFGWDGEGRLTAAEIWDGAAWQRTEFAWDAEGRRIKERTPDGKTTYHFFDEVEQDKAGRLVKRYGLGGEPVAWRDGAGVLRYLHTDLLGSISLVSDDKGNIVDEYQYDPFGLIQNGTIGDSDRRGFTGAQHDLSTGLPGVAGSGLVSLGARSYDPVSRRFLSPDTILPTLQASGGLSRYAYGLNNPAQFTDPTGHAPENVMPSPGFGGGDAGPGWGSGGGWTGLPAGVGGGLPTNYPGVFNPVFSPATLESAVRATAAVGAMAAVAYAAPLLAPEAGELALAARDLPLKAFVYVQATYPTIGRVMLAMLGVSPAASKVVGPDGGAAGAAAKGAAGLLGQSFGKLGTVVPNPGLVITEITEHGLDQIVTRGVSPGTILDTTLYPAVVLQQSGGQFLYLSNMAAVVLNSAGRLITAYPASMFGPNVNGLLGLLPR